MRFPWQKAAPITLGQLVSEFVESYQKLIPGETPREIDADFIEWEKADGTTHTVMLGKVIDQVARLQKNTLAARREIYEGFIGALFGGEAIPAHFDAPEFAARVLPSIRERAYLDHVRTHAKMEVPHRDLSSDLIVSYVIDFPDKVAHISSVQAEELGLDEAGLFELALKNLGAMLSREGFRSIYDPQQSIVALPCTDGHAAARLLLVRQYLEDGEEIAAVVSDGAMLTLLGVPPDGNWNGLRKFASDANPTGFSRPFWVRPGQIELM